jgi:hypothetical protein
MGSEVMDDGVMENHEYPTWQKLCHNALVELDKDKLRERVAVAEEAISSRLRIMSSVGESLRERHAIEDAQTVLRVLKTEILGLPEGKGE